MGLFPDLETTSHSSVPIKTFYLPKDPHRATYICARAALLPVLTQLKKTAGNLTGKDNRYKRLTELRYQKEDFYA